LQCCVFPAREVATNLRLGTALAALNNFKGTWRRFEYKGIMGTGALLYDDYAHHPTEIQSTIQAAKDFFKNKKLIVVFQPHLYSRTKLLLDQFAKSFGGEHSGRFVNGVLGAVYKELGEPGKEDQGGKKNGKVKYEDMPLQRLGGAVVYSKHNGQYYLALVHDVFGHWTLSKGKIGDNPAIEKETAEKGTTREIKEEIGLDIVIEGKIGENEYVASHPERGKYRKHVVYFLARAEFEPLQLQKGKGGLDDAKWFRLQDIIDLNFYDDMLPIVTAAVQRLLDKSGVAASSHA